jgi:antitoxin YefM
MTTVTATQARADFYSLMDLAARSHKPIMITGRRQNAVLVSGEDFRAIQETLYILSIPGMRESLRKAIKTPLKSCSKKRPW